MNGGLFFTKFGLTLATLIMLAGIIVFAATCPGTFIIAVFGVLITTIVFMIWTDILGT